MYVCICNALKDRQIKAQLGSGPGEARSIGEVFRRCGTRPRCGKCLPDIARMIDDSRGCENAAMAAE